MSKRERYLTTAALISSVIPLLFMAFTLKLLPVRLPIVDLNIENETPEFISKYNNLIMGLFCIVPLSIVTIARYLKRRTVHFRNYTAILLVSMALSLSFTGIVLYGFIIQVKSVPIEYFDVFSLTAVIVSLIIATLGPFVRYRKFGSKVGFVNRYTRSSQSVWKIVHAHCATIQTILFVSLSIPLSFIKGYSTTIILACFIVAYCIFTLYYSRTIKVILDNKAIVHSASKQ